MLESGEMPNCMLLCSFGLSASTPLISSETYLVESCIPTILFQDLMSAASAHLLYAGKNQLRCGDHGRREVRFTFQNIA